MPKDRVITVKAVIEIPRVPNFILYETKELGKVSIADLDEETLRKIGEQWTEKLVNRSEEIRRHRLMQEMGD